MFLLYSCMAMTNKERLGYVCIIFMYGDVQLREFGVCLYYIHVWRCPIKSFGYVCIIFMYVDVQ